MCPELCTLCCFERLIKLAYFFPSRIRDVIADYGPSLTIFAFTGFTLIPSFSSVNVVRINIPQTFNTTSGRPWLVDLNDPGLSTTAKGLAFFPALVLTALYFFDHNVSALLTHRIKYSKSSKPMRQVCYDWDFMVLGVMMIVCAFLGLPPCNGLIPNSPMHSKALEVYEDVTKRRKQSISGEEAMQVAPLEAQLAKIYALLKHSIGGEESIRRKSIGGEESIRRTSISGEAAKVQALLAQVVQSPQSPAPSVEFDYVVDQRLSNLLQSGMVAVMLVILPVLALVPTSVVTGLFLFMGVESLLEGDIFSRMIFPFVQKEFLASLGFEDRLKKDNFLQNHTKQINVYTLIQLVAFGIVFYVTQTSASIAFPVFILLLIPLRFSLLPRLKPFFDQEFINTIDQPLILAADEEEREVNIEVNIETGNIEMQPASADESNIAEAAADVSVAVSSPPRTPPAPPDLLTSFRTPPAHVSQPSGLHHRTASA